VDVNKAETLQKIEQLGILAVLRGPSPDLTIKMVAALIEGGVTGIEITYSTPNASEVVRSLDQEFGSQILLGAKFLVSPHIEKTLASEMASCGLPVMMGALTPSEVMKARAYGSDVVKMFPGSLGGPTYMKALKGPFPDIPMMPTGGVNENNLGEWFAAGAFAVGAGSNLCPKEIAMAGEFQKITVIAKRFISALQTARHSS
jgi:2-dehydro-3-deoxyphosphogluconate aldolase/(4S)-4-hydroxy-2-oxoglutarate aldolase